MKYIISGLIFITYFFVACASREALPAPEQPLIKEGEKIIAREAWEQKWEKAMKEAKREGRVVVYGGSAAVALKTHATRLIKEKFGFDLEVLALRGAEIRPKIVMERSRGLFIPDVYTSGVSDIYDTLKPLGAVDPLEPELILPEVLDPKVWFGGNLPWGDKERKVFIWPGFPFTQLSINTVFVKPEEMKSYNDLLNPKWKGKVVINDPTVEGAGQNSFVSMIYNKMVDADFFPQLLKKQQPMVLRDQILQIQWLVRGKYPIALWASTGRMQQYLQAGAPIDLVIPEEGAVLSGGGGAVSLMNKAPHPNAARVFINWLLSKEGQMLIQKAAGKQSLRLDIPEEGLEGSRIRVPGEKYFLDINNDEEFVLKERGKIVDMAKEFFEPYMK